MSMQRILPQIEEAVMPITEDDMAYCVKCGTIQVRSRITGKPCLPCALEERVKAIEAALDPKDGGTK